MRKNILRIYGTVLSVGGLYYVFTLITGISIPCVYNQLFGIMCPGCGTTRLFKALLRLDFAEAFYHNPVVFVLLIIWNIIAALLFFGKPKILKKPAVLYTLFGVTVFVMFVFGILRNLP